MNNLEKFLKVFEVLNSNQYIESKKVLYDPSSINDEIKINSLYEEEITKISSLLLFECGVDDMSYLDFIDGKYKIKQDNLLYEFEVFNNKINGEFKISYHKTGKVCASCNFVNNNKHGDLIYSGWEDGRITKFAQYENNKLHGIFVLINGEGVLCEVTQYQNGSKLGFFYNKNNMFLNMGFNNQETQFNFEYRNNISFTSFFQFNNSKKIFRLQKEEEQESLFEFPYNDIEEMLPDGVCIIKRYDKITGHLHSQSKINDKNLIEYICYHKNTTIPCLYLFFNVQTKEYTETLYWVDGTVRYTKTSTNIRDINNSIFFENFDDDFYDF
jgi:antitoxin component YwqK of YwqJK toxin-antitoxin module